MNNGKNENLPATILENSPIGYCIITPDLELEYINDQLLAFLEVAPKEVMGKAWIDTILKKNYIEGRRPILERWLRSRFSPRSLTGKYVIKIFDELRLEFFVQVDSLHEIKNESGSEIKSKTENELETKKNAPKAPSKKLVTIYPVSGTILLYHSRMTLKLDTEYEIAGRIQRNINDYIVDMIEGRYFKYHFKRLFMPSGILSGDIVNVKTVSRRYSSVFIGDGRGHGFPAALYSALIHSYLNMMATEINQGVDSTAKLMTEMNRFACRDFSETGEFYFFSGVYGLIDGNTKKFCITNAGHPYPIFIRDGKAAKLSTNGQLAGINDKSVYSENCFDLQDGDLVLFFTDGIFDVIKTENELDHDSVIKLVTKYLDENANNATGLFDYLAETIETFKSRLEIDDDITMLQMLVEEKKTNLL